MNRLTFTKKREVYWDDTLAGSIEPMSTGAGKWAYLPEAGVKVPLALHETIYRNTQREIKSWLLRKVRIANH